MVEIFEEIVPYKMLPRTFCYALEFVSKNYHEVPSVFILLLHVLPIVNITKNSLHVFIHMHNVNPCSECRLELTQV